ncbi:hypothetical protein B5F40_05340 [Gordonibacter sp. An230]|nr:hypothetical protein B5F40_05340 [Gordonibacter sp. An230]
MELMGHERAHVRVFDGREQAAVEAFDCIETFYDRVGEHSAPGRPSPDGFVKRTGRSEELRRSRLEGVDGIGMDSGFRHAPFSCPPVAFGGRKGKEGKSSFPGWDLRPYARKGEYTLSCTTKRNGAAF